MRGVVVRSRLGWTLVLALRGWRSARRWASAAGDRVVNGLLTAALSWGAALPPAPSVAGRVRASRWVMAACAAVMARLLDLGTRRCT
jgi:hypothetical protein